jgi:hypothetical protein
MTLSKRFFGGFAAGLVVLLLVGIGQPTGWKLANNSPVPG